MHNPVSLDHAAAGISCCCLHLERKPVFTCKWCQNNNLLTRK